MVSRGLHIAHMRVSRYFAQKPVGFCAVCVPVGTQLFPSDPIYIAGSVGSIGFSWLPDLPDWITNIQKEMQIALSMIRIDK